MDNVKNKKIVFTAAIMDLMHTGHLNLLKAMKGEGDYVAVVLHDDSSCYQIKGKTPIQNLNSRTQNLVISGLVDVVIVTHSTDPADGFHTVFNTWGEDNDLMFMRGDDNTNPPGFHYIKMKGIPYKFVPYTKGISSTQLRNNLLT